MNPMEKAGWFYLWLTSQRWFPIATVLTALAVVIIWENV